MKKESLNKTELVDAIVANLSDQHTKKAVKEIVDATLATILETFESGKSIRVVGFGSFELREKAERTGRNPKTGEKMTIPRSVNVNFKVTQSVKDKLREI